MNERKACEEKLDALDEWTEQIHVLEAGTDKAEAKIEYGRTVEALQAKRDETKTKLQELKETDDKAWEDLNSGAGKAWGEVEIALHSTASKLT